MRLTETRLRAILAVFYWAVAFVVLIIFSLDDPFGARPRARNHTIATAQLAFALAMYDFLVSVAVAATTSAVEKISIRRWLSVLLTTLIVGAGMAYLPLWIYRGYSNFRFANTRADVRCFFTEGYGIAFLFIVAPILAFMTVLREVVLQRLLRGGA